MFIFLCISFLWAADNTLISTWLTKQPSVQKLFHTHPKVSKEEASQVYALIRKQLAKRTLTAFNKLTKQGCTAQANVSFPLKEHHNQFFRSIFSVETQICLQNTTIEATKKLYLSPDFRQKIMFGIKKIWREGTTTCILSQNIPGILSGAHYCVQLQETQQPNYHLIHMHLLNSKHQSPFQPVYLLEESLLLIQSGKDVSLNRIMYNRSRESNSASQLLVSQFAQRSQKKVMQAMQDRLNQQKN